MLMNFLLDLFGHEVLLFGTTLLVGIVTAYRYIKIASAAPIIQAPNFTLDQVIFLAIVIAFFILATRMKKWGAYILWGFFVLVVWSGVQVVSDTFVTLSVGLFSGLSVVILFFFWRTVLMHDIAIVLALAGIGAAIGSSMTPTVGVSALVVLSFYDIIAVYLTHQMVQTAQSMIRSGAIFGFIIPSDFKLYLTDRRQAQTKLGEQF